MSTLLLFDTCFSVRDTQRVCHSSSVGRIGLIAVADMPDLYDLVTGTHVPCRVFKKTLLCIGRHQSEQFARLFVVVIIVFAEIPPFDVTVYLLYWFIIFGLLLPYIVAVR